MTVALSHDLVFRANRQAWDSAPADVANPLHNLRLTKPAALTAADHAKWDELGKARSGDNMFAEPWMTRLSLAHCDPGKTAHLAIVEDATGKWIGVLPILRSRRLGRLFWPNWSVWGHPNQFNNTPLVRAGEEMSFWRSLLAGLDCHRGGAIALCLTELAADDPVTAALVELCQSDGRTWKTYRQRPRACLIMDDGVRGRMDATFRPKHRRRIDSLERQLVAEHGEVHLRSTRDPAEIARLVDQFLELEAAGWKGAAGSAMGHISETRSLFRAVAMAAAERGQFEISWLEVADQPIDMTTQFLGSRWSSGYKRAHDERYARFAPGQLHLRRLTQCLIDAGGANFDSSAAPDQESINRMWPDRRELFDCYVAIGGPLRTLACSSLSLAREAFHRGKRMAKHIAG